MTFMMKDMQAVESTPLPSTLDDGEQLWIVQRQKPRPFVFAIAPLKRDHSALVID
jgi:hypothetical protein